ncbi:MAG: doxx family protein [Flavobacteriaceae bacterium]
MKEILLLSKRRLSQIAILPVSIGLVYLWFGSLKFFAGVSPAEQLAQNTITHLTAGLILPELSILMLAIWETAIGLLLIFNLWTRFALQLALVHILLTFSPFVFFSELLWTNAPFGLTLLGQYIVKNIIILGVLVVLLWKKKGETVSVSH